MIATIIVITIATLLVGSGIVAYRYGNKEKRMNRASQESSPIEKKSVETKRWLKTFGIFKTPIVMLLLVVVALSLYRVIRYEELPPSGGGVDRITLELQRGAPSGNPINKTIDNEEWKLVIRDCIVDGKQPTLRSLDLRIQGYDYEGEELVKAGPERPLTDKWSMNKYVKFQIRMGENSYVEELPRDVLWLVKQPV